MRPRSLPAIFSGDLRSTLEGLRTVERKAVLFGLNQGWPLNQVVNLSWADVKRKELKPESEAILRSMPQHLFTSLVFWDFVGGKPYPLYSLSRNLTQAGVLSYDEWLKAWPNLVWLEYADLKREAQRVRLCLLNTVSRSRMKA